MMGNTNPSKTVECVTSLNMLVRVRGMVTWARVMGRSGALPALCQTYHMNMFVRLHLPALGIMVTITHQPRMDQDLLLPPYATAFLLLGVEGSFDGVQLPLLRVARDHHGVGHISR